MAFNLNKVIFPSFKDILCQVWFGCMQTVVVEKILKNLVNVYSLLCWNLPFKKGWGPTFQKKNPLTQGCFVPIWMKFSQWFWRRSRKYKKFTTTTTKTYNFLAEKPTNEPSAQVRKKQLTLDGYVVKCFNFLNWVPFIAHHFSLAKLEENKCVWYFL